MSSATTHSNIHYFLHEDSMTPTTAARAMLMTLVTACALAVVYSSSAAALTRADCERDFKPHVGQAGKDVIWVPTPDELVQRMLTMARVTPNDTLFDLGAGDGKIAIAAGKIGAKSVGIEYNPSMAKLANCMAQAEGVAGKTTIIQGDIFKEDFSRATVVTMYLLPQLNLCVRHRLLAMNPGTRVASNQFDMAEWKPDQTSDVDGRTGFLWIVPARVAGIWVLKDANGGSTTVDLAQTFQAVTGEVVGGAKPQALTSATLRGDQLKFSFSDEAGATLTFTGTVRGDRLTGTLQNGSVRVPTAGAVQGRLRPATWAEMPEQCRRFYSS